MAFDAKTNIFKLLNQVDELEHKKQNLINELKLIDKCDIDTIDDIENIENEIDYISNYQESLKTQAIVMMNEHKIYDINL